MGETKGVGTATVVAADAPYQATDAGGIDDMATPTSKRTTSPAFQFYPKEFLSSSKVLRMSNTEIGVYTKLLCLTWLDHGLPTDLGQVARMVGVPARQFTKMWSGPLGECFYEKGGKFQNLRLDKERKIQADYRAKKQAAANERWSKQQTCTAPAVHMERNAPLPQIASADRNPQERHTRPTTLIRKRRLDAAWEGARVWVPQRTHNDFLGYRGGNEPDLFAWYAEVDEGYRGEIDPNMFEFWRARYRQKWPSGDDKPKSRWGNWAAEKGSAS